MYQWKQKMPEKMLLMAGLITMELKYKPCKQNACLNKPQGPISPLLLLPPCGIDGTTQEVVLLR